MKVDKIFSSLFFACVAAACLAAPLNSDGWKVSNNRCGDISTSENNNGYIFNEQSNKSGDNCYYYKNNECFKGTCSGNGCTKCTKSMNLLIIVLLFSGTFCILAFSYLLLEGIISK